MCDFCFVSCFFVTINSRAATASRFHCANCTCLNFFYYRNALLVLITLGMKIESFDVHCHYRNKSINNRHTRVLINI